VGPEYHALHHIDPLNFFGSTVRVINWVLGTASKLRGRRVTSTGVGGALGQALVRELQDAQVRSIRALRFGHDWSLDDYSALKPVLRETEILILAHGTKDEALAFESNCNAPVRMIELFRSLRCERGSAVDTKSAVQPTDIGSPQPLVSHETCFLPSASPKLDKHCRLVGTRRSVGCEWKECKWYVTRIRNGNLNMARQSGHHRSSKYP
jgi:hypothetical protein